VPSPSRRPNAPAASCTAHSVSAPLRYPLRLARPQPLPGEHVGGASPSPAQLAA
jgi:hypothetical protein